MNGDERWESWLLLEVDRYVSTSREERSVYHIHVPLIPSTTSPQQQEKKPHPSPSPKTPAAPLPTQSPPPVPAHA